MGINIFNEKGGKVELTEETGVYVDGMLLKDSTDWKIESSAGKITELSIKLVVNNSPFSRS